MSVKDIAGNPSYGPVTLPDFTHMYAGVECSREEFDKLDTRFKDTPVTKAGIESVIKVMRGTKGSPEILEPAVANSVEATLAQRGSRYGDFTDHARLCQALMLELQEFKPEGTPAGGATKWEMLTPVQRQALTVICDKIARILSGDPNYDDNWHDIQGYAKLVEDRLPDVVAKREKAEFDKLPKHQQDVYTDLDKAMYFGDSK